MAPVLLMTPVRIMPELLPSSVEVPETVSGPVPAIVPPAHLMPPLAVTAALKVCVPATNLTGVAPLNDAGLLNALLPPKAMVCELDPVTKEPLCVPLPERPKPPPAPAPATVTMPSFLTKGEMMLKPVPDVFCIEAPLAMLIVSVAVPLIAASLAMLNWPVPVMLMDALPLSVTGFVVEVKLRNPLSLMVVLLIGIAPTAPSKIPELVS